MSKIKMDTLRPWIATRVTQFLGFEDEVLINFIYELLEGKVTHSKSYFLGTCNSNSTIVAGDLWF